MIRRPARSTRVRSSAASDVYKRQEVNWPSMSYIGIPIILAYGIEKIGAYRKALAMATITLCILLLFLFPTVLDRSGFSYPIPLKMDSMKRMAGWKELSQKVMDVKRTHPDFHSILTDSYHVASELSFYSLFPNIYCLNNGRRMNQFDIWGGLE